MTDPVAPTDGLRRAVTCVPDRWSSTTEPGLWIAHTCFNVKRFACFGDSFAFIGEKSDKQKMLVSENFSYQYGSIKVGVYFRCIICNKLNLSLITLRWYVFRLMKLYFTVYGPYEGNQKDRLTNGIYDKLFCGNNLPAINTSGHIYVPQFTQEESVRLTEILIDGIAHIRKMLAWQSDFLRNRIVCLLLCRQSQCNM